MRGRIYTDREGDHPGENDGNERHQNREKQTVADDIADRQLIFERIAEVALEKAADPEKITRDWWFVEAVFLSQEVDPAHIGAFTLRLQLGDIVTEVVAGRQID